MKLMQRVPQFFHQMLRRERIALSLIFVIMLLDIIGISILFPISAYIVRQYSDQALMVTLLSVIYAAAQFFAAPVIGKISDRVGRRSVLLICLAGAAVGYFVFGIAGSLWILFLSRLIAGITGGSLSTASAYIVDVTKPEDLARAFSLMGLAWGIGLVLGPALGGALGQIDLRAPGFFSSAIAFGALCLSFFYLPESLPPERRQVTPLRLSDLNVFSSISAIGRLPGLAGILLSNTLFNFAFNAMVATETLFLILRFSAQPWHLGLLNVCAGISLAVVQALFIKPLVSRLGEAKVTFLCILLMSVSALAININPIFLLIYPIIILRSAFMGFVIPLMSTLSAQRVSRQEQGQLMGVTTALNSLMAIFAPILAGLLFDHWFPGVTYWLAAIVFVAAAFILRAQPRPALTLGN
jgi:MFS transporter, DHA1 family, tetracycline resistance protein